MNKLPSHLLDGILFRLQPTSLANLRCVNKSLNSYISDNPIFESEYFSRLRSTLLNRSSFGSRFNPVPVHYFIVGSSSGLLLLCISGLCVVNPLTKKFKFIDHSSAKLFPKLLNRDSDIPSGLVIETVEKSKIGFVVDQIDRNKQRFKIVCLFDRLASNEIDTVYKFEIYSGNSWRKSQTKLICYTSELYESCHSTKPVYVNGCLHWLRIDGSIIVFDLESEEARLIPVEFPMKSEVVFCVVENCVNLVCASKEVIYIHVLEEKGNIRWNLVKEVLFEEGNLFEWRVEAFDGRLMVVREGVKEGGGGVIHGFEIEKKKWEVLGSIPRWGDKCQDFYLFKVSWDCVDGLDEMLKMNGEVDDIDGSCVSTLRKIIRIIRFFAQV